MSCNRLFVPFVFILLTSVLAGYAQPVEDSALSIELDSLAVSSIPQLNEPVDISLSGLGLSEFLRSVSHQIGLNINTDSSLDFPINSNYSGVKAKDLIEMLCEEYNLDVDFYGNIINLKPKVVDISKKYVLYDKSQDKLNYDLQNCPLNEFTKALSEQSPYNFFIVGGIENLPVNGFANSLDGSDALAGLAESNGFTLREEKDHLYILEQRILEGGKRGGLGTIKPFRRDQLAEVDDEGRITAKGENLSCETLFQFVAEKLNIPFHQTKPLEGNKTLSLQKVSFDSFMDALVSKTGQTYKYQEDILYLGDRSRKDMKTSRLVSFEYRRVDSLTQMLPRNIFQDVEVKEFSELNGLILIGDKDVVDDAVSFLKQIDVSVPVVLIDVLIVDVKNTEQMETGIEAGILKSSADPVESGGTINPGINYTLNAESVNKAISRLGLTKLGKVTPNFYLSLKALETNGVIDIRSTPQLSTLNGHAATMSIGETQYYKESSSLYQGSLTTQIETSVRYTPIEAKLGIIIEPFVTGTGDVTLNVEVEQSSFSSSYEENGPPGIIARKFKSMIRVKNQEMVLLGGLEELDKERSRSGLPFIARVPVISWFFTSRTSRNNKSRLNIFIKPTILY